MPPLQSPIPPVTPGGLVTVPQASTARLVMSGLQEGSHNCSHSLPRPCRRTQPLKTRVRYPGHACSASEVSGVVNIPTLWTVRYLLVIRRVIFGE